MKKIFNKIGLLLCMAILVTVLSSCGNGGEASQVDASLDAVSQSSNSLVVSNTDAGNEVPTPPTTETAGAKMEKDPQLLSEIEEFVNMTHIGGSSFEYNTISDSVMARCGIFLSLNLSAIQYTDDGYVCIDAVFFDKAVLDYFGQPIKDVTGLNDYMPTYQEGKYYWYPTGLGNSYIFEAEELVDLDNGYIRAEGKALLYETGEEEPSEELEAVVIVLQKPESPYGFHFIAQSVK